MAPNTTEQEWMNLAGKNDRLRNGMGRLYQLFQKAPVLGSLISPRTGEADLLVAAFNELQPLLEKALAQGVKDDTVHEMAVTARGVTKAADILSGQFTLVATNVPYLGIRKQCTTLKEFATTYFPDAKECLSTVFCTRILDWLDETTMAIVTPQNWFISFVIETIEQMSKTIPSN